ncbi:MAG: SDR family oxidoreductase [Myxococcales bacterium]|nr:SDR family oxidoreductase [Myxococcales bacterium]
MSVLVTGASRGIGKAICARLILQGDVVGVYRDNHAAASALSDELAGSAHSLSLLACDLVDPAARDQLPRRLGALEQKLSGVVLNAGVARYAPFAGDASRPGEGALSDAATRLDPLLEELRSNLEAPLALLQTLLRSELILDGASLVFISSNLARHALAGHVGYASAKAGLEAAVKQLCAELAPRGIRVNAVAPGLIRTDMTSHMSEAELARYALEVPLGRAGVPEDVARCVAFFLSEQSAYVSGQVLDVDGGWGSR